MPGRPTYFYWDSCTFLSYCNGNPDRLPTLQALLEQVVNSKDIRILTSTLTIVEVAYVLKEGVQDVSQETLEAIEDVWAERDILEFVEFHRVTAYAARELMRDAVRYGWKPLKPIDAIHLAIARVVARNADVREVHTYDEELWKWSKHLSLKICEPQVNQLLLF